MKKCPKCGTILDDSKKKCYMCGTSLDDSTKLGFASAFEKAISSKVSDNTDNIFNNGKDIKVKSEDVVKKNNNGTYFNPNGDFTAFSSELERLTSIKTEKMSDKEIENNNKQKEKITENISKNPKRKEIKPKEPKRTKEKKGKFFNDVDEKKSSITKKTDKLKKERVPKEKTKKITVKEEKAKREIKLSKPLIFNVLCILIFIGLLVFAYSIITNKKNPKVDLGGLSYLMNPEFKTSSSDGYSKFYTYGDNCTIRISYGNVNNSDGFIDNYFETQKKYFESEEGNKAVKEKITINDNVWDSMKIVNFKADDNSKKLIENIKYRYNAIIYQGNFYYIVFVNSNNNDTCTTMYNEFIETLDFNK